MLPVDLKLRGKDGATGYISFAQIFQTAEVEEEFSTGNEEYKGDDEKTDNS